MKTTTELLKELFNLAREHDCLSLESDKAKVASEIRGKIDEIEIAAKEWKPDWFNKEIPQCPSPK